MNYDWYTTNYPRTALYATLSLIVQATVYNKPFTFNWSLKIGGLYFIKFPRQSNILRTKYQNPGLSRTIREEWHV